MLCFIVIVSVLYWQKKENIVITKTKAFITSSGKHSSVSSNLGIFVQFNFGCRKDRVRV